MVIEIADAIKQKIDELEQIRKTVRKRGEQKAETKAAYEKQITIVLIDLKNGVEYELDGRKIKEPPASIMDKLARGLCWRESLEMEKADASYKSAVVNLEAVSTQINALQSINRYLDRS
jgi:hypothetical protein